MRRPTRFLLASAFILTGCSALIGVNDLDQFQVERG